MTDYEDTLRRLLKGNFADLSPQERQERSDQIIRLSATAAMALGAAPLPFLELPVLVTMVRAIGKVYGVESTGKKALLQLLVSLGGGILLRQGLRLLPFGGSLPFLSRIYGATYALGKATQLYFSRGEPLPKEDMRRVFQETLKAKTEEQAGHMESVDFEGRLRTLESLKDKNLISEQEYRERRGALLAML